MGILTTVSTSVKIQGSVLTIALFSQLPLKDSCTWHPQCLSQLDLQSTPLGLQLVSAQVHVESIVVQLESALVHLAIQTI
ncbi:hypothetical protein Tco_0587815 [Tanacetum coccineum]